MHYGMKGDLYSPTCHSITLKIQNRVRLLGFFCLVQKMGRHKFVCFRRGCEWELVGSLKCSSACEAKSSIPTKVSLLTLGTQLGTRKERKKPESPTEVQWSTTFIYTLAVILIKLHTLFKSS